MPDLDDVALDHVALAVEDADVVAPLLDGVDGRALGRGGEAPGFRARQWQFCNGMKLELLEPLRIEENDFVRRFLDRNGPGVAHHLTFRVPNLLASVSMLEAAGVPVLYVRTDNPAWKEAFIHPKNGFGTVVQLAEYQAPNAEHHWYPSSCRTALGAVELKVGDLEAAIRFFGSMLGGSEADGAGRHGLGRDAVLLRWPGSGGLALVPGRDDDLSGQPGRITRLIFNRSHHLRCDHQRATDPGQEQGNPLLGTPWTIRNEDA